MSKINTLLFDCLDFLGEMEFISDLLQIIEDLGQQEASLDKDNRTMMLLDIYQERNRVLRRKIEHNILQAQRLVKVGLERPDECNGTEASQATVEYRNEPSE